MLRKGDCSSWVARACLRVPSKTASPVVFTNSVRRMESFSVRALVRRVKIRPPAMAERSAAAARPAQSQVLERGAVDGQDDEAGPTPFADGTETSGIAEPEFAATTVDLDCRSGEVLPSSGPACCGPTTEAEAAEPEAAA